MVSWSQDTSYPHVTSVQEISRSFIPIIVLLCSTIVRIDIPSGVKTFRQDIVLDPGRAVDGTIVDPEGKPVPGVRVYGLENLGGWTDRPLADSTFRVVALPATTVDANGEIPPVRSLSSCTCRAACRAGSDLKGY